MRGTRRSTLLRCLLALLAEVMLMVPSVAVAPPAQAAPRILQARTTSSTPLPSTTDRKMVQQVTLGSGPWTVIAKAFVVDLTPGESDFFRCQLYKTATGTQLDASAAWVSSDAPGNMITNLAKLKVAAGATVVIQQRCWHDHDGVDHAYLDPGATLLAFRALSAGGNRAYRTNQQIQLPTYPAQVTVATLGVGTGSWLFGFKATAVNVSTTEDRVYCSLPELGQTNTAVAALSTWPLVSTFAGFGATVTTEPTTLVVTCSSSKGATYLDPGLVFWARQVSSAVIGHTCGTVTGATANTDLVADVRFVSTCPVGSGAGASQVGGAAITAGSWVVLGAEQGFGGVTTPEFVRCQAKDITHNRYVDQNATLWVRPVHNAVFMSGSTYLGKLSRSEDTTVQFRCGQDAATAPNADDYYGGYLLLRP